jgi:hypothetical protein
MDFIEKNQEQTLGLLHGFDRVVFRGYLSSFFVPTGMYYYLSQMGIKLTGYKNFVANQTSILRKHIEQLAGQLNIKIEYANNSKTNKDELAKAYLEKHPTKQGLIAIISCLELCPTFCLRGNYLKKELEIRKELGQHLHYYLYYMDQEFGWMHIKIQTYYPFTMQVYLNGREWLKRSLDKLNIGYKSYNNSLSWVSDMDKAQQLSDSLVQKKWDRFLDVFAQRLNPHLGQIQTIFQGKGYHWCLHQCEYATDVLFKERNYLEALYSSLVYYATQFRGGEDIYTFFGRNLHHLSTKEVTGNTKRFIQGFRVKHYLDRNSIKMYDKHTILRIETTINNPKAFKIYKTVERKGKKTKAWVPMGKAVSNLYRYAQIARSANRKYLNSLAMVDQAKNLSKQIERLSQRTFFQTKTGRIRPVAGFNLLTKQTCQLLLSVNDARFSIQAFNNKQLRDLLIEKKVFLPDENDQGALKKLSSKVTRLLSKLRTHKLISKVNHSFKYKPTKLGLLVGCKILNFKNIPLASN